MTSPVIRTDTAPAKAILAHLERCSDRFSPPLAERVNLAEYAARLSRLATRFEAWDDARLVALVAVYCNAPDRMIAFVSNVSVDETHLRQGLSRHLLQSAAAFARKRGFAKLSLEADASAVSALALYRALGFVKVDEVGRTLTMQMDLGKDVA